MKLTIKYFASVREQVGVMSEILHIDAAELAVESLRAALASRDDRMAQALHADRPIRTAVNQEMVSGEFVVRDDSEVAFFPPVTGG
jgi:molybdopterin synthase sulfur carrier subunit